MSKSQRKEADIQKAVIQVMAQTGWWVARIHNSPYPGRANTRTKGVPDYLAIKDSQMLWLEFKAPGKDLTPEQQEFFDRVKKVKTVQCLKVSDMGDVMKQMERG